MVGVLARLAVEEAVLRDLAPQPVVDVQKVEIAVNIPGVRAELEPGEQGQLSLI